VQPAANSAMTAVLTATFMGVLPRIKMPPQGALWGFEVTTQPQKGAAS
jgi:hypothetical protein